MRGAALVREEPDDLRRLMIGKPQPIAKCPKFVALFRADRAARQDPVDRYLELAAALVQLIREAGCEQAGRQGDHADADDANRARQQLAPRRHRHDIAVADRGHRGDRPVHGVGDAAKLLGLSLALRHVGEARRRDQQHREDEQRGADRLGFVAQHACQQPHRWLISSELEYREQAKDAHETQIDRDQRDQIERHDHHQVHQRERGHGVAQPADDRPPVTAVIALHRRPQPERVFRRKGQDRDHLESM